MEVLSLRVLLPKLERTQPELILHVFLNIEFGFRIGWRKNSECGILKITQLRWKKRRNSLIEQTQGNRNPFIDHPEVVERVKDF
jgi:hypothetical protein